MFLFSLILTKVDLELTQLSNKIDDEIYRYEKYVNIINSRNKNGQVIRNRIHFNRFKRQKSANINKKMVLFNTCVDANNTLCGYIFEKQPFFNNKHIEFHLDKYYVTRELIFESFSDDCFASSINIKILLQDGHVSRNVALDKSGTTVTFENPLLLKGFVIDKYEGGVGHKVCLPITRANVYEE